MYWGFGLGLVEWVQDIPRGYLGRGYGILGMWSEQLVYKKVGSVFWWVEVYWLGVGGTVFYEGNLLTQM